MGAAMNGPGARVKGQNRQLIATQFIEELAIELRFVLFRCAFRVTRFRVPPYHHPTGPQQRDDKPGRQPRQQRTQRAGQFVFLATIFHFSIILLPCRSRRRP